ncbi:hypothetical protein OPV22_024522 [Ensete ventricosum]|uniref:N-acetyltransferase domain-containing protein n=1 Tax=Ensete ventricosum TaxID=4639 RepID=A0AAV8QGZ8_ENSVE|nr:hypothetical protein OPV22_024522 [Ensete ventricosum]
MGATPTRRSSAGTCGRRCSLTRGSGLYAWVGVGGGGRPIGAVSVELGAGCDRCKGELGYVLAAAHWGRGYATAAVKMAVRSVFQEVEGLERVEALVDVDNKGSQRVLEKAGFVREGVLRKSMVLKGRTRDMVMFSFISTDGG